MRQRDVEFRMKFVFCGMRGLCGNIRINRSNKTIPSSCDRFDVLRLAGGVAERFADFVHSSIQAVIEINKSVPSPKPLSQIIPGYNLSGPSDQHRKNLQGLLLQPHANTIFAQFSGDKIELKDAKADIRCSRVCLR